MSHSRVFLPLSRNKLERGGADRNPLNNLLDLFRGSAAFLKPIKMDFIIDFIDNFLNSLRNLVKIPSKAPQAPPTVDLIYKIPICLALAWIGSFIFEGIYNTSNHPLAGFPGPTLAAFTSWYKTYIEVFRGESWIDVLERLHKKYGTSLRKIL